MINKIGLILRLAKKQVDGFFDEIGGQFMA
jgi:hypothetical protein